MASENEVFAVALALHLRARGYATTRVTNGSEAIDAYVAYNGQIDVLAAELRLRDMPAIALLRELREWNPYLKGVIWSDALQDFDADQPTMLHQEVVFVSLSHDIPTLVSAVEAACEAPAPGA